MSTPLSAAALEEVFVRCRDMDGSLGERLQAFADAVRDASATFADAVDQLVDRLKRSNVGATAPAPGEPMPDFVLPDEAGRLTDLQTLLKDGPAAIVFHRGHWCPYCRINTHSLADVYDRVRDEGGKIVAIVPDRQPYAAMLKEEAHARFPILVDIDNGYALALNLVFWVHDEMRDMIKAAGWDVAAYQGNDAWMLPVPATFVVGTDGLVKARYIDPDYRKRMAVQDLLEAFGEAR